MSKNKIKCDRSTGIKLESIYYFGPHVKATPELAASFVGKPVSVLDDELGVITEAVLDETSNSVKLTIVITSACTITKFPVKDITSVSMGHLRPLTKEETWQNLH